MRFDTKNNRPYFIDHNSKTTTFNDPRAVYRTPQPIQQVPQPQQPTQQAPPITLPPGWQMKLDPQGRPYYIDHNTRTTTYQAPTVK